MHQHSRRQGAVPWPVLAVLVAATACGSRESAETMTEPEPQESAATFGDDVAFLREHTPVVVLGASGQAQVVVAPAWQGRVMTSTATGDAGLSHGYLHRPVIALGEPQPHMTVLGGEDRFWLGPEGGQFGLYFPVGSAFSTDTWQVPSVIDWDAWPVADQSPTHVRVTRDATVTNHSGTRFDVRIDRTVRLLDDDAIRAAAGPALPAGVRAVAYESDNVLTNAGDRPWTREGGALSIWILGMYPPGPNTTVMLPFTGHADDGLGPVVNDAYFGAIPAERLRVSDGVIYFRGDGAERGKIGVGVARARNVAGSYDPDRGVLTVVTFTLPADAQDYVNSMWEVQAQPFAGDVVNSYNDGPLGPGQPPLGPFYEIESSSPAAFLGPGASLRHVHRTFHFEGTRADLEAIAEAMLGTGLP